MTANTNINIYVWGNESALSSTAKLDVLEGADATRTLNNIGIRDALRLGATINVPVTTNNQAYVVLPFSVAQLFGGVMPKYWGLFVTQNTGANLRDDAVNTNSFEFVGVKYDNA
jgi:hypothetical protein